MIIVDWLTDPDVSIGIRSTPVYRGEIITRKGMIPGVPEWSSRRYSIIDSRDPQNKLLIIGAVAYESNYDSDDIFEPLRRYKSNEWDNLVVLRASSTLDLTQWTGEAIKMKDFV